MWAWVCLMERVSCAPLAEKSVAAVQCIPRDVGRATIDNPQMLITGQDP